MFMRAGPDAELFHVVAHGGDFARVGAGSIAKISDDILDFAKRDEIAQSFLARVKPYGLATVFGEVGAEEFLGLETSGEEMHVVNEGVGHASGGQSAGGFPLPSTPG